MIDRRFVFNLDGFTITGSQDVEPFLDANKVLFNEGDGYTPSRDMRRVATIPNIIAEKWLIEEGIDVHNRDHWPAVKRKLNSNEWRYLRTAPGTI